MTYQLKLEDYIQMIDSLREHHNVTVEMIENSVHDYGYAVRKAVDDYKIVYRHLDYVVGLMRNLETVEETAPNFIEDLIEVRLQLHIARTNLGHANDALIRAIEASSKLR